MSDNSVVSVKILEVNEVSFSMKSLPENIHEVEFGKNLQYGLGFNLSVDHKSNIFRIRILVNYSVNTVNDIMVSSEVDVVFQVKNLNNVVKVDELTKKMDIQNEFLSTLVGVCIGTSRGVLSTKTKGTPFAKAPLPIINSKDVVSKMMGVQVKK